MPEKRKFYRFSTACLVRVREVEKSEEWGAARHTSLKDISMTGMSFVAQHRYPVGTLLALEITLEGWPAVRAQVCPGEGHETLALVGEVMRVREGRPGGWEIGIHFLSLDEWDRVSLYEYLKRIGRPSK